MENTQNNVLIEERDISFKHLHNVVNLIKTLQNKDMDVVLPITGIKGIGKSSLALQITRVYLEKFFPNINLYHNLQNFLAFTTEQVYENLLNDEFENLPLVIDEAYRCMASEDWMKVESKTLKKIFAQIRVRHRAILACLPDFWWLDRKYREDMVHFWMHVIGRGVAILFTADLSIGIKDKWHRKEFEEVKSRSNLKKRIDIFTPTEKVLELYTRHPCYFDIVVFPKADEVVYQKYLRFRKEALITQIKEQIQEPRLKKSSAQVLIAWELRKKGLSMQKIADFLNLNPATIFYWLKDEENIKKQIEQATKA